MSRWLGNNAVQGEMASILQNRESAWMQSSPSKDKPFWCRRVRVTSANSIDYWLKTLQWPYYAVGTFMGTNILNWDAMDIQPPPLRAKGNRRAEHKCAWEDYLLPKKCEERGVDWNDIWLGKSMLFDFDHRTQPMLAFDSAMKTASYLVDELGCTPKMVFSGSKGFHVHVNEIEAAELTDCILSDYSTQKDPLRVVGKLYGSVVETIAKAATNVKFPVEDRSSNFRQGIVRCPYSIHPKTGQIVWPLDDRNIEGLGLLDDKSSIEDIARQLHAWDIPSQSSLVAEGGLTYISPESRCIGRGMPEFKI